MVTFILLVIGGLNWLLIGLFDWGVGMVLGATLAKIVYILVGISAVVEVCTHKGNCKCCAASGSSMPMGGQPKM